MVSTPGSLAVRAIAACKPKRPSVLRPKRPVGVGKTANGGGVAKCGCGSGAAKGGGGGWNGRRRKERQCFR